MIQPIMKDEVFLAQKSVPAVNCEEDIQVARDLLETLKAHKEGCVGMAANMIGVSKRIIAFDNEGTYMVMFNTRMNSSRPDSRPLPLGQLRSSSTRSTTATALLFNACQGVLLYAKYH